MSRPEQPRLSAGDQDDEEAVIYLTAFVATLIFSGAVDGQKQDARKETEQTPVIVFVCEHGAAKSVMAAAHFNKLARERGLNLRAVARGTSPDKEIAPKAALGLQADGLTSS
jgi:pyruvate/2-oxoglutarate dehydrogenase complex dihydrolipoamide acyltransferase (E2) component